MVGGDKCALYYWALVPKLLLTGETWSLGRKKALSGLCWQGVSIRRENIE